MPDRNAHTTAYASRDVLAATLLILAMALFGVGLFALAILVTQRLSEGGIDAGALEPGLGLSNQGLTVAFALAGAVASTAVAFAALRAQQSASRAQEESARQDAKQRLYGAARRDVMRHAGVIAALNAVFATAHEIAEDLLREVAEELSPDESLVAPYESGPKQGAERLAIAHRRFWNAIDHAQQTELANLALDTFWIYFSERAESPLRLSVLSRHLGFFGGEAAPLTPGTLASRSTPMTASLARDVLSLARFAAQEVPAERVRRELQ